MRWGFLLLALVGFGVFAGSIALTPPVECQILAATQVRGLSAPPERYCGQPRAQLETFWEQLDEERLKIEAEIEVAEIKFGDDMMALSAQERARRDNAIIEEPEALKELRRQHIHITIEQNDIRSALRVHDLRIGLIGLVTGGAGLLFFALSFVPGLLSARQTAPSKFAKLVPTADVERWLDPHKAEADLATLDEKLGLAIARLWAMRPKHCEYCDKALPDEPTGKIEHVTLLKKAPGDVKNPKRIVLGQGYRAIPPEFVACADCGHKHKL